MLLCNGGSWTLRVPKTAGPDVWTRVQLLAIGEKLQSALEEGDQLCGVGLSVRFSSHLITIWHRDSSKKGSVDGMLACIMEELPSDLQPKPDNYFYKRHCDHAGFKAPPGLKAPEADGGATLKAPSQPDVRVDPPSAS